MAGFTSVDLSRLPPPNVVEVVDFETIVSEMLTDLRTRDPVYDALVESDPAYKILEVAAYREMLLRQRVNDAAKAVMLAYAAGPDLDQLGAWPFNVARLVLDPGDPSQGIDPTLESDDDYRRRIQLSPEGFSVAGPQGAYVFQALSADPGVVDATADSPAPGEVLVSILARAGDGTAPQELVDTVAGKLAGDDVRPMTDKVTVQSADVVHYTIEATIYTFAGPDSDVVLNASKTSAQSYTVDSHRMGRDITLDGVYAALRVAGVQKVVLTSPAAEIVITEQQAPYCDGITLTYGGIGE